MLLVHDNPILAWSMQYSWTRPCRSTSRKALASFSYFALSAELLRQTTSAWNALSLGLAKRRSCRMSSAAPFLKPRYSDNWCHSSAMLTAKSYSSSSEGDPFFQNWSFAIRIKFRNLNQIRLHFNQVLPQGAEEFCYSLALLCKPYILTYMKDAPIQ